jgi:hypothetical protein
VLGVVDHPLEDFVHLRVKTTPKVRKQTPTTVYACIRPNKKYKGEEERNQRRARSPKFTRLRGVSPLTTMSGMGGKVQITDVTTSSGRPFT